MKLLKPHPNSLGLSYALIGEIAGKARTGHCLGLTITINAACATLGTNGSSVQFLRELARVDVEIEQMATNNVLEVDLSEMRYDITMPLFEGKVTIDGVKLKPTKPHQWCLAITRN